MATPSSANIPSQRVEDTNHTHTDPPPPTDDLPSEDLSSNEQGARGYTEGAHTTRPHGGFPNFERELLEETSPPQDEQELTRKETCLSDEGFFKTLESGHPFSDTKEPNKREEEMFNQLETMFIEQERQSGTPGHSTKRYRIKKIDNDLIGYKRVSL